MTLHVCRECENSWRDGAATKCPHCHAKLNLAPPKGIYTKRELLPYGEPCWLRWSGDKFRGAERNNVKSEMEQALEANGWTMYKAAKSLGVPLTTFHDRMKKYGIVR